MGKKHLITCSVIVVLVIVSTLNIFSTEPVIPAKNSTYIPSDLLFSKAAAETEMG